MSYYGWPYTYTTTTSATASNWYVTTTSSQPYVCSQPQVVCTWPTEPEEEKEDPHMEKCKHCEEDIIRISSDEWREDVSTKKDKEPVYKWHKYTVKEFACGTIRREGELPEGVRRVTIGKGCIELAV